MNDMSAQLEEVDMRLTQMGAKVTSLHGIVSFIHFTIDQTELFYVYNINAKDEYFLQMVKPYPAGAGIFSKPQDIIEYIKKDIRQFQNATNSNVFGEFVAVNQGLYTLIRSIKCVFMTYNVPKEKMRQIKEKVDEIAALLDEIRSTSTHL